MPASIRSGNWSDPTMWDLGAVPISGDIVTITPGHIVTYNMLSNEILSDIVINGTLKISRSTNTRLSTNGNIIVAMGGVLDMGTAADPIPPNVFCEIFWVLSLTVAQGYVGGGEFAPSDKGLWAMEGSVWEVHGADVMRPWTKLMQTVPAGGSQLIVEHDVRDWYVGGSIVIAMTNAPEHRRGGPWQNEVRKIASITRLTDGTTQINLDSPLDFSHDALPLMRGEVGLLSRNVRFETTIIGMTESDHTINSNRLFAHTMRMMGSVGHQQYAEFKFMGHFLKIGRYPIHPHRLGEGSRGMMIRGNAIWYSGFRWVNVHSSNGVTIEDNIGFSGLTVGYFAESDWTPDANPDPIPGTVPQDTAWIHNLGIECSAPGTAQLLPDLQVDFSRMAAFWPTGSLGEAHIGNVAVATRGGNNTGGFSYSEGVSPGGRGGTIGEVFVKNESHSCGVHGWTSWSNRKVALDAVELHTWRNAFSGFSLGAYNGHFSMYNAMVLENRNPQQIGSSIIETFLQDSLIVGGNPLVDVGHFINAYQKIQVPDRPHWHARNTYRNLAIGYTHLHGVCTNPAAEKDPIALNDDANKDCSADYSFVLSPRFESVGTPIDFGWQANANAFHRVANPIGVDPALPPNFYLNRRDQLDPLAQGPLSASIIGDGSNTVYYGPYDALVTTTPALMDYPPQISLNVTLNGKIATLRAIATDDRDVPRVEFFLDWIKVATLTAPPYEITIDLSTHPRKYAYLYARAFDTTAIYTEHDFELDAGAITIPYFQRSYSSVVELGPEVLQATPPPPPPILVGDTNFDGGINLVDVLVIIDWLLGRVPQPAPGSNGFIAGDTNRNGTIDLGDALRIIDFILGRIPSV